MNQGGKGDKPRPFSIAHDEYSKRWDAIFQRDLPKEENKLAEKVVEQIEKSIEQSKK